MNLPGFKRPNRALALWAILCLAFAAVLLVYDVALARYATHLRENDFRTHLGFATECMEEKDYVGAAQHVERAKRLAPENPEPWAYAAGIHYRLRHWEPAIKNFEKAVALGDNSRGPRMDIVWGLIEMGRFEEAATAGEQYILEIEDNSPLLQYTAEAYIRSKQPEKAVPLLERALERAPDNLHHLSRLERAYMDMDDTAAAEKVAGRIAAIHETIGQLGTSDQ